MTDLWLDNFLDHLAGGGIGTVATDVFQHEFPTDRTEGIVVANTGGIRVINRSLPRRPRVQIMTRYKNPRTCMQKIQAIITRLSTHDIMQGGDRFLYFKRIDEPAQISKTQLGLHRFVCNFELHVI